METIGTQHGSSASAASDRRERKGGTPVANACAARDRRARRTDAVRPVCAQCNLHDARMPLGGASELARRRKRVGRPPCIASRAAQAQSHPRVILLSKGHLSGVKVARFLTRRWQVRTGSKCNHFLSALHFCTHTRQCPSPRIAAAGAAAPQAPRTPRRDPRLFFRSTSREARRRAQCLCMPRPRGTARRPAGTHRPSFCNLCTLSP